MLVLVVPRSDTWPSTGSTPPTRPQRRPPERYEPLPGLPQLPGWVWRKIGRPLRAVVVVGVLAVVAMAVAAVPALREASGERAASERRERAKLRERHIEELQAEQRPRLASSASIAPIGAGAPAQLEARAGLMAELSDSILADARRRVRLGALEGPIVGVTCEPFPRTVEGIGADKDLSSRRGRYSCIATRSEFARTEESVGGLLGYPYRAMVDFRTGRYALCKISGRPDPTPDSRVTTPRACGG